MKNKKLALWLLLWTPIFIGAQTYGPVVNRPIQGSGGGASGLTVGTTTITSGTNTRVLFNDSGVVGEDSGFTFTKATDAITIGVLQLDGTTTTIDSMPAGGIKVTGGNATNAMIAGSANGSLGLASGENGVNGQYVALNGYNGSAWSAGIKVANTGSGSLDVTLPNGATITGVLAAVGGLTVRSSTYASGSNVGLTVQGSLTGNAQEWKNSAGTRKAYVDVNGSMFLEGSGFLYGDNTTPHVKLTNAGGAFFGYGTAEVACASNCGPYFGSTAMNYFATEVGLLTGGGAISNGKTAELRSVITSYTWANAQVTGLGAVTTGDWIAFTLPARTQLKNMYVVITGAAGTVATLTVSCGRTAANYIDYIVASDAKAAANTIYGNDAAERGTNLTGYDLPSYTATTAVRCQFISTGGNLNTVTGSAGTIVVETVKIP